MSFVDMLTPMTPTTTAAPSSSSSATADAVFTNEEISMIQEMFLSAAAGGMEPLKIVVDEAAMISEKDFQISDISISDGGLLKADELMLGADDATSVLLSPIGSDETFLNQFLFDEKDAMAAFYTEAIDPFQCSTPSSPVKAEDESATKPQTVQRSSSTTSPLDCDSEKTLLKLRAKVEALTKMYYTRCHRLNGGSEDSAVEVEKVKLVHAIEKLQRIAEGLAKLNAQLVKETTSITQQRAQLLSQMSDELNDATVIEKIVASINDQVCTEAIARATKIATEASIESEEREVMGWKHKSAITGGDNETHMLSYTLEKQCESVNMNEVMRNTWECESSSEKFSAIIGGPLNARVVKNVNANAVVLLYDVTSKDSMRVDRVLSLMFRVELPNNRFLMGSYSINPTSLPASSNKNVRWMESSMWQIHEKKSETEHLVIVGGSTAYPTKEEAQAMAVEYVCAVLKWESLAMGPVFRI